MNILEELTNKIEIDFFYDIHCGIRISFSPEKRNIRNIRNLGSKLAVKSNMNF